jgi:hypothetical protein
MTRPLCGCGRRLLRALRRACLCRSRLPPPPQPPAGRALFTAVGARCAASARCDEQRSRRPPTPSSLPLPDDPSAPKHPTRLAPRRAAHRQRGAVAEEGRPRRRDRPGAPQHAAPCWALKRRGRGRCSAAAPRLVAERGRRCAHEHKAHSPRAGGGRGTLCEVFAARPPAARRLCRRACCTTRASRPRREGACRWCCRRAVPAWCRWRWAGAVRGAWPAFSLLLLALRRRRLLAPSSRPQPHSPHHPDLATARRHLLAPVPLSLPRRRPLSRITGSPPTRS